jgi:hypothetical protein
VGFLWASDRRGLRSGFNRCAACGNARCATSSFPNCFLFFFIFFCCVRGKRSTLKLTLFLRALRVGAGSIRADRRDF